MSQREPIGVNGTNNGQPEEQSAAQEQKGAPSAQAAQDEYAESPRKPRAERKETFDAGVWLLQGLAGLSEELRHSDLGLPEDFWVHAYAARKEALLATRVLIDAALERCAEEEAGKKVGKKSHPQRGKVSIDFG